MLPLTLLLAGLIAVAIVAHIVRQWIYGKNTDETADFSANDTSGETTETTKSDNGNQKEKDAACRGCAAESEACYADRMLGEHALDIVYFDDEELDRYKGTPADSYSPEQTEEFRDILNTMMPREIPDWLHSLQLREIELPAELRDEAIMLMEHTNS